VDIALPVEFDANCRLAGRLRARFLDSGVEAAYRDWRAERAIPFVRIAMLASIVGWTAFAGAALLIGPEFSFLILPVIALTATPLIVGVFASTYWQRWRRWVLPASALANTFSGTIAVLLLHYGPLFADELTFADIGTATAMVFVYYACTIMRLPPLLAAATIAPYVVLQEVLLLRAYGADVDRAIAYTALQLVAVVSGLLLSASLERQWRTAFQQERLIESQQRVIAQERERSEQLLHNILPQQVADQLKSQSGTVAEAYDEATVLFADLVGFTPMSAELSPTRLVAMLNEVFSAFDALCVRHGVEKIKTIGDAYMAVAGVPMPRTDHAEACADLALAMRAEVTELSARLGRTLDFRIGMHLGPVVAGVIGASKFAYDLWGDTVNTAARMESHGLPGQIQVSEPLALRLRERGYRLTERGPIEIKGKGMIRTWLLDAAPVQST